MMYRKFTADALFTGEHFLTGREVLITDEEGRIMDIIPAARGAQETGIEHFKGTICPGLINTHCHLELSWMKNNVPKNTGMVDFLLTVMKTERPGTVEIQEAIGKAELEMIDSGIIAVGDICNTTNTVNRKQEGNLYYHNFVEAMGFVDGSAEQRFGQALEVFKAFAAIYPLPLACNSIVPHSPYSVSKTLFQKITGFPGNHLLSIHNQENEAENEFFLSGTGDFHRLFKGIGVDSSFHQATNTTSLKNYLPWFKSNQTVLLVHNVETTNDDLAFIEEMRNKGIDSWLCLCPNANLYINSKLPDIEMIDANTDQITLGTDGLASNDQLSILEEIKTIHHSVPGLAIEKLLKWATLNGAKALEIEDETGSFEKGKQPGIVWLKGVLPGSIDENATSMRIL